MALTAKLQFGDNGFRRYSREYLVTDYTCRLHRRHNGARPDAQSSCDHIELTVVAPGKEDLNLFEWYIDRAVISGRILVELPATDRSRTDETREIQFENGVCYSIKEEYDIDQHRRRTLRLSIAVEELTVDHFVFSNG